MGFTEPRVLRDVLLLRREVGEVADAVFDGAGVPDLAGS